MAMLCPHLTEQEAVKAFKSGNGSVACPSIHVYQAFQVVSYHAEYVEEIKEWRKETRVVVGQKNHPAMLRRAFASRTEKSYADGMSHGDLFHRYPAMFQAMSFAEHNWGSELVLDNWVDVGQIYVQDPTDLVNDAYHHNDPRTKAALYITLNRGRNKMLNDHVKPTSELFDEAIVEMTLDSILWSELKGGRGSFIDFNCAHCGSGLALDHCPGCGYRFTDDHERRFLGTPLSRKMVRFLRENGREFKIDPEIAWRNERKLWQWAIEHHKA
jgi:hypothetical protein